MLNRDLFNLKKRIGMDNMIFVLFEFAHWYLFGSLLNKHCCSPQEGKQNILCVFKDYKWCISNWIYSKAWCIMSLLKGPMWSFLVNKHSFCFSSSVTHQNALCIMWYYKSTECIFFLKKTFAKQTFLKIWKQIAVFLDETAVSSHAVTAVTITDL